MTSRSNLATEAQLALTSAQHPTVDARNAYAESIWCGRVLDMSEDSEDPLELRDVRGGERSSAHFCGRYAARGDGMVRTGP